MPDQALGSLKAGLSGTVLSPGDEQFDEAVLIWNGMVQKRPTLVARPGTPADVQACVGFARENGVMLSVKGGGHNIAGTSLADRGLATVMSGMRGVEVDPERRLARVEAGLAPQQNP